MFTLQTKKPTGSADEAYVFLDGEEDIGEEGWPKGWYLDDYETFGTKTFAAGEGFLLYTSLTGATLTYSGEVLTGPIEIPLVNGFSLESNPRPVALNIQNIIPVNADGEVEYGGVFTLQTKLATGSADEAYVFLDGEEDIGEEGWPKGWYLDDYETFGTKTFNPGEGFLMYTSLTGAKLTFAKMAL